MSEDPPTLLRRVAAEMVGTAFLLAVIVGSGIAGDHLAGGQVAIALLVNALATGAGLVALILTFGPISGAHFNPAVTLADASLGGLRWQEVPAYVAAQLLGALMGVAVAHGMFDLPIFTQSQHPRHGVGQCLSEAVATFGLVAVIWGCTRHRPPGAAVAVGAYITAGYWFTASTALANPAVTIARSLTNTFSGIRPVDVPAFLLMQAMGAAAATAFFRWLVPSLRTRAAAVVVPHVSASVPAAPPERVP